jgi:protein required for attachment to host cells
MIEKFWDTEEKNLYTVIADSRRAKIFTKRVGNKAEINLVREIVSTHFKNLYNEISDIDRGSFAEAISQMLNDLDIQNVDSIMLIAPPRMQKLISACLETQILEKLVVKASEDIVWMESRDINRYVNNLIFANAA